MKRIIFIILFFIFTSILLSQTFYFYLPWDDSSQTILDLSWLNHKPAGKFGFVDVGLDGHFYVGQERIKFLGVNFTAASCFPTKDQAEKIAKRLAKFGINIVRLHFLDNMWGFSIFGYPGSYTNTRTFNQDALDRLDYFIAKLKENGIYVNINLLVGRNFLPGDGLPTSINQLDWKQKQVPAMFYQTMIDLQKEYATNLLTRLNPYTSTYYNNEPAIAIVEILNEHGLIQGWLDGTIDILPSEFADDLKEKWNDWLLAKYQNHSNLVASGWALSEPIGEELLKNTDFSQGFTYWNCEQHDVAKASFTIVNEGPSGEKAVKIRIENTSSTSWHVQFNQPNLVVSSTRPYTLSFYAKADRDISINVQIGQAHDPWNILGFDRTINLTTYYQLFTFELTVSADDTNARVNFTNMCKELATYWFSNISFKPGGSIGLLPSENLDNKTIELIKYQQRNLRTRKAQTDWVEFLYELEEDFWLTMYNHLKNSVGIKCPITGTTVGLTSLPNIMSKLDFVDTHSYWHHPVFPGTAWDMNNWYVTNATLVKDLNGGTISEIAMRRVYGKPFTISEYNHPAPNTFSAECFIFLSAYASFQDWDGIFGYTYLDGKTNFNMQRIEGFFDLNQHPTKFLSFIPAALIYRRGDFQSSSGDFVVVQINKQDEINQALNTWAWRLIQADDKGMNRKTALLYKTAQIMENGPTPQNYLTPSQVTIPPNNYYISDTQQLKWDTANGVCIGDSPRSKFLVGYLNSQYNLSDGIVVKNVSSLQNNWATITITSLSDKSFSDLNYNTSGQILITALGSCGNPAMNWMIYPNTPVSFPPPANQNITVGNQWGNSPSFVEGINCDIILPYPVSRVKVYALDNTGLRKTSLPITSENNKAKISLSYTYQTLCYEVEVSTYDQTQVLDNPPSVEIVSPVNNSEVSFSTTIVVNVQDDFGIIKVEFYINEKLVNTSTSLPYQYIWFTTSTSNGLHYIKVIAYDTMLQSTTAQISLYVNNPYYPVYTQVNPPDSGSISKYPDKQLYLKGETVQLYASGFQGFKFLNWSGEVQSSSNPITIIVDSTKTITANFELISTTTTILSATTIWVNLLDGQYISGVVNIKIVCQDEVAINNIKIYKNDNNILEISTYTTISDYSFVWNTLQEENGFYTLKIEATNIQNQTTQKIINVYVNNVPNNTPPQISLNLAPGTTISNDIEIVPEITSDDNVIKVEYYLNENLIYTSTSAPFSFIIVPKLYSEGSYFLKILVYDEVNQTGETTIAINIIHPKKTLQEYRDTFILTLNKDDRNESIEFKFEEEIEEIIIYDIKGKHIRTLKETFSWDGKDSNSKKVKSGIYLYKCKLKNSTIKFGKIIIIN